MGYIISNNKGKIMTKIVLFAILSVAALNGMDPTSLSELRRTGLKKSHPGHYGLGLGSVPLEIQSILDNCKDGEIEDAILSIRIRCLGDQELENMVNDSHEFTKLVHVVADKFKVSTYAAAKTFKTPIAGEYVTLGDALIRFTEQNNCTALIALIVQGADVNYTKDINHLIEPTGQYATLLIMAVKAQVDTGIIELLLDNGADVSLKDEKGFTALDYVDSVYLDEAEKLEISQMLKSNAHVTVKK